LCHRETFCAVNSNYDFVSSSLEATRKHVAIHFVIFDY